MFTMKEEEVVIHIRLPRVLVKKLDHIAVNDDLYRSALYEKLLTSAIEGNDKR